MSVQVRLDELKVGLRTPVATARGTVFERVGLVIVLTDEQGRWGRGEVAPLPGWSTISLDTAKVEVAGWIRDTDQLGSPAPTALLSPQVRAGVDAALWSLQAAQHELPLWRALGGDGDEASVAVNALIAASDTVELAAAVSDAIAAGYTTLKMKLGLGDDVERLSVLAEAIAGADATMRVRLDANAAWTVQQARDAMGEAMRVLGETLEYVEDPVASLDELSACRAFDQPIAVDELVRDAADLDRVIQDRLADVLVIKPALIGGLTESLALAEQARRAGIDVVISSLYDGPVGLAAWCHLAAALGNKRAHGLGTAAILDDGGAEHLIPRGGLIRF